MTSVKMDEVINDLLKKANVPDAWTGKIGGAIPESAAEIGGDPVLAALVARLPIVTRWAEMVAEKVANDYQIAVRQVKISPDADMAFHVVFVVDRADYLRPDLIHAKYAVDAMLAKAQSTDIRYRFDVFDQSSHSGYRGAQDTMATKSALQRLVISKDL